MTRPLTFSRSVYLLEMVWLSLLMILTISRAVWSEEGQETPQYLEMEISGSPVMVDQPVISLPRLPQDELPATLIPPSVIQRQEIARTGVSSTVPRGSSRSDDGTIVSLPHSGDPGLDVSELIATNTWNAKLSRTESGEYYVVLHNQDTPPTIGLKVYKNTGDPATTPWEFVVAIDHPSESMIYADIEAISDEDRCFIIYRQEDAIKTFWFQLSDPTNYDFVTVTDNVNYTLYYCSITSDDVEYSSGVYLYACWKEGYVIKFKRSVDQGLTWQDEVTVTYTCSFMLTGNSITYCPQDDHVFILYHDTSNDVQVAECSGASGTGTWTSTEVMSSDIIPFYTCSITSNYEGYILATAVAPLSGGSNDIVWVYSDNGGASWSNVYHWDWEGMQYLASCASNSDGCFSMLYYYEPEGRMESAYTTYDNISTQDWIYEPVDNEHGTTENLSACIEDGPEPDHGGAWSTGYTWLSDSYFGWAEEEAPLLTLAMTYNSGSPVSPGGGNVYFDVFLENVSGQTLDFDAWIAIEFEGGPPTTVIMRSLTNYLPGWIINRPDTWFPVPGTYPAGNYELFGRAGTHPNEIWAEDGFAFVKSGVTDANGFTPFVPDGHFPNPFNEIIKGESHVVIPTDCTLLGVYPNPFNPSTVIAYQLPVVSHVNLSVYDIAGRKLIELVDGWRDAGVHEVTFDASDLVSGIYFARLETEEYVAFKKLVLTK